MNINKNNINNNSDNKYDNMSRTKTKTALKKLPNFIIFTKALSTISPDNISNNNHHNNDNNYYNNIFNTSNTTYQFYSKSSNRPLNRN